MVAACDVNTIPLYTAELFGTFIETGFYGAMIPAAIRTLKKLERRRKDDNGKVMRVFQAITCLMIVLATWHFTVECYRILYASLHFDRSDDRTAWLSDSREVTQSLKDFPIILQTLTGDGILLYRCYLLWPDRKWVAILPTLSYFASWGFGLAGAGRESQRIEPTAFSREVEQLTLGFFISSAITVIASTSVILAKVWLARRRLPGGGSLLFTPSLAMLLESGVLYCLLVTVLLALYGSHCQPYIVFYEMLGPVIPILFCTVLLKVSGTKDQHGIDSSKDSPIGRWTRTISFSQRDQSRSIARQPSVHMGVHIQQEIELSSIDQGEPESGKGVGLSRIRWGDSEE